MENRRASFNESSRKYFTQRDSAGRNKLNPASNYSRLNIRRLTIADSSKEGVNKPRNLQSSLTAVDLVEAKKKASLKQAYRKLQRLSPMSAHTNRKSKEPSTDEDFYTVDENDVTSWLKYITGQAKSLHESLLTESEKKAVIERRRQFKIRDEQIDQAIQHESKYWREDESIGITDSEHAYLDGLKNEPQNEGEDYEYNYITTSDMDRVRRLSEILREQEANRALDSRNAHKLRHDRPDLNDPQPENLFRDSALSYHSIYSHEENQELTPVEVDQVRRQSVDYSIMMTQEEHDKLYADIVLQIKPSNASMSLEDRRIDSEGWQCRLNTLAKRDPKTHAILSKTPGYPSADTKKKTSFTPTGCVTVRRNRDGKCQFKFVPNQKPDDVCGVKKSEPQNRRKCHAAEAHK